MANWNAFGFTLFTAQLKCLEYGCSRLSKTDARSKLWKFGYEQYFHVLVSSRFTYS